MSNFQNITENQLDLILKVVGKQLGVEPNALKQQLQNGDLSAVNAKLGSRASQQLGELISDPQKARQAVCSADVAKILKNIK